MAKEKTNDIVDVEEKTEIQKKLVLFNDDRSTFDFVIYCLVEICKHSPIQAENCTMIAHHKGRCVVKKGLFKELEPIHKMMSQFLTVELQ